MNRSPPPSIVEYVRIGILLSLLTIVETLLSDVLRDLLEQSAYYVSPHVYGAVVYSTIGLTLLAIGFVVYRRMTNSTDHLDDVRPIQPLLTLALLIVGGSYVGSNLPTPPASLVQSFVVSVVGMGVLSVAYVRARDINLRIGSPKGPASRMIPIAGLGPVLLVVFTLAVWDSVGTSQVVFGRQYLRTVSIVAVGQYTVVASVSAAFGAGLLFHGAVQESLREYATPAGAIAGVTILVSLHRWMALRLIALDRVTLLLVILPTIALVVLGTALVVRLAQPLGRMWGGTWSGNATAAAVGTAVMVLFLLAWYGVLGDLSTWFGGYALVYTATVGIAAVVYERTRSVWVPMLAIASFYVSTDIVPFLLLTW